VIKISDDSIATKSLASNGYGSNDETLLVVTFYWDTLYINDVIVIKISMAL